MNPLETVESASISSERRATARPLKIAYLAAGAAGMYCGSCLHDNTLAAALSKAGEDILLVPTYTPLRTDETDVSEHRVRFGGINVYLQEKLPLFRHTPWFVDRWLDSSWLLGALSKMKFSVQAEKLGALTVSMLRGEHGHQRKEVAKLVDWLKTEVRPDVVHLSNVLLIGLAHEIRRELKVPIICGLSGEDIFLEKLPPRYYGEARDLLRERAGDVTAFTALNRYYADFMSQYMEIEPRRIEVIPHGLKLAGHGTRQTSQSDPFTLGYFARICHDKGLHQLVTAFKLLADDPSLPPIRLRVAGYLGSGDRKYFAELKSRLEGWGLADRFEYHGELSREQKIQFLQSLDLMCLPTVYRESKGLSVLEAWANAVPVVLPAHGTFPELIADTHGGLLHEPHDPHHLAQTIAPLVLDRQRAAEMGRQGQQAVQARYNDQVMAQRTREFYKRVITESSSK
jgi:glycosyltransferase involved in cell wall biosynthesis